MDGIYCNHGFSGSVVEHKQKALLVAASFRATGVHQLASVWWLYRYLYSAKVQAYILVSRAAFRVPCPVFCAASQ